MMNKIGVLLEKYSETFIESLIIVGPKIIAVIIIFIILNLVVKYLMKVAKLFLTHKLLKQLINESQDELDKRINTVHRIIARIAYTVLWGAGGLIVLSQLGINIGPILATAGVLGLAVSFGAQNLIKDFISGLFIIIENQIRLGDVAIINGTGGLVEAINLRTVVLRDLAGVVHVFPNGSINTIANMTFGWSACVFNIGVAYKEDIDRVSQVMIDVLEQMRQEEPYNDMILEEMELFGIEDFADSSVIIKARVKTKPIKQWEVARAYRGRLKKAFDEQGIEIPFPHRSIYFGEVSQAFKVLMEQKQTIESK